MTVTERLGRSLAQGAMNEVSDRFEPPWWLILLANLGIFAWAMHSGSKKQDADDDIVIYYF